MKKVQTIEARFRKEELEVEFELGKLEERYNNAKKIIRYRVNSKGTKCWSVYGTYAEKTNLDDRGILTSTAKIGWHAVKAEEANLQLAQECGITLVDFVNIEEFFKERETRNINAETEVKADVEDYAVTVEAQNVAIDAETELANTAAKVEVKSDRITELKAKSKELWEKFRASLQGYYVKSNGNFFSTDKALDFTTFLDNEYDWLYRKDDNGEYVEISVEEFDKINRIEIELNVVNNGINAEIARNAVKFVAGKWYTDSEGCKYLILKRTAKIVTVYNQDQDDWNALKSYDANDEIDGEFDCIFRKKIQFDERGEYVDWEDEEGELVQVFAKNETEPPTDDDDNNDGNDDEDNEEIDNGEESTNVEVENNVEEVKEDEPKFEVGKTYYINVDGKPFTLKVEARTQKMLTGTTINGTRKYHVCDTIFGDYVATDLRDEFGNAEMIWAANEYKPEVEATELSDELIDEYIISEAAQTEALRAELYNAERAKGNYSYDLNGEHVFFENNQITRIDATRTIGMLFSRNNGKKQFFTVATQCGRMIQGSMKAIAASKVAERYMAKEKAKAQGEFFRNFFNAYQNNGGFFEVITEIVYADGNDHAFTKGFEYFNQAQEFVSEVKKVIDDNPTQIFIKRNQQGGKLFYHRQTDGTETYYLPNTLPAPTAVHERIDELKAAIDDNQQALDQLRDNPDFIRIRQNLMEARDYLEKAIEYYEFILHEKEPCRPFTVEEDAEILTGIIEDFKAQRENATDPAEIAELDKNITDVIKERQDTIQKRMNAIVEERNDICDELDEADGNSEVPQARIDSREGRLKTLRAEYGRLFELREKFRREVPRPNQKFFENYELVEIEYFAGGSRECWEPINAKK